MNQKASDHQGNKSTLFYQFKLSQPKDPLQHIKSFIIQKQHQLKNPPNSMIPKVWKREIQNMTDFLTFVESNEKHIAVLRKSNKSFENDAGIGGTIFFIKSFDKPSVCLEGDSKEETIGYLYESDNSHKDEVYFEKTRINGIYLWYEKRPKTQESIGTVNNDEFKGFVKYLPQ